MKAFTLLNSRHCLAMLSLVSTLWPASLSAQNAPKETTETRASEKIQSNRFYHYSIWGAFVNRVFEGFLPCSQLKVNGDIGLGSYTRLAGEMVMLDGVPYKIDEAGKVTVAKDDEMLVYANATHFTTEDEYSIPEVSDYKMLREVIGSRLPSRNYFYAFKVHGTFAKMKCGGLTEQTPPFETGLDVLIPNRPIFGAENVSGTMVGFFCPSFIGEINVAGFHMHFISDDRTFGGHAIEFEGNDLTVEVDRMTEYTFVLPESGSFEKVEFDKQFQYKQK